jgi:uncharacterized GH25 family protein
MLVFLGIVSQQPKCHCQLAQADDRAHGANQTIVLSHKTVKRISGRVLYQDGTPVSQAVVEVYENADSDKVDAYRTTRTKERRAACLADESGRFCFRDLPSGRYLVRAGTRTSAGMQEIIVKVTLDRHWWSSWVRSNKEIEVDLEPGF